MYERIIRMANRTAERFGTRDPEEICRRLGIVVVHTDLPKMVSGFYMENGGRQAVVISDVLEPPYSDVCVAHELGHALLHKGINTVFISENTNLVVGKYEREADLFAVSLLMDETDAGLFDKSTEEIASETALPEYAVEMWWIHKKPHCVR